MFKGEDELSWLELIPKEQIEGAQMERSLSSDSEIVQTGFLPLQTPLPQAPTPAPIEIKRYHEYPADFFAEENLARNAKQPYKSAYQEATVLERAHPWFVPKRICHHQAPPHSTEEVHCCAETVAISLDQDDHHIVNTVDGMDLADILQEQYPNRGGLEFSDSGFKLRAHNYRNHLLINENVAPCLQPGTIISIDNHSGTLAHFFCKIRPKMKHEYVIITSESDGESPRNYWEQIYKDSHMIRWYGTNPIPQWLPENNQRSPQGEALTQEMKDRSKGKFRAMPLGLSKWHDQSRMLNKFWELRNYTDPFSGAQRKRWTQSSAWDALKTNNTDQINDAFYDNVYVRWAINNPHSNATRGPLFRQLCDEVDKPSTGRKNKDDFSCHADGHMNPDAQYRATSKFLFGFSPKGAGWDCYRNYELLMLGVIPIVPKLPLGSMDLFENLPVIELDDFYKHRTRAEYMQIFNDYIQSPKFQNMDTAAGYKRLFLRHWRRLLLQDAGRDKDILVDPATGREYYQAWRYYAMGPNPPPTPAPTEALKQQS